MIVIKTVIGINYQLILYNIFGINLEFQTKKTALTLSLLNHRSLG
jgi:hypothetical protein